MGTNTGLGIGVGIPFKNNALGGDKPYFPPELKARMIGVWTSYGKKNTDADRNIIKNKIPNAGGDLEILNSAYKLNSGFGEYKVDFLDWTINSPFINERTSFTFSSFNDTNNDIITVYQRVPAVVQSFKIKTKLRGRVLYRYYVNKGDTISVSYYEVKEGINILPDSVDPTSVNGKAGFVLKGLSSIKVEQIPSFEGAFVTDGIDDLITSTKTLQEMLGGSNEITVVSMMANLDSRQILCNSNFSNVNGYNVRNTLEPNGVISMLGYTDKNGTTNNLNLIMGDKDSIKLTDKVNFNSDYVFYPAQYYKAYYQVAWYWTFIANRVLTTDEINQVIAYYNLDRTLRPDILCNITKQGITNDNHADFNDKLIDYSGNGRDIQMNNLAWKGGSGIAAKPFETIKDYTILSDEARQKLTIYNEFSYKVKSNTPNHYWIVQSIIKDNTSYQVTIITDKDCYWINSTSFINNEGNKESIRKEYPVKANTPTQVTICGLNEFEYPEDIEPTTAVSYVNLNYAGEVTVTFIPSCKGGLLLDGVNDFGKVTGMPIYKDYTIVVDYERISGREEALISKAYRVNQGAFVLMETSETAKHSYSFGAYTAFNRDDFTRTLLYQSKYKCGDVNLIVGKGIDGDTLWLGTLRDNDYRFFNGAIYSLMSFPYSMSEFLIERQLKKHKLGTLYPDMVEFRPVIKANANYKITYYQIDSTNTWKSIKVGDYIVIGAKLAFQITFDNDASELKEVVSPQLSGIIVEKRPSNPGYNIYSYITSKSPQKINITIDEYIRFEDIVQPYPLFFEFTDENGNLISWGGKAKVGNTITRSKSVSNANILAGLYNTSNYKLNGKPLEGNSYVVEKQMVFKTTTTYLLDNNEPKCILSPSRLRIPNSSYKLLGYIPDISGHGNHGVIHNSAYAEGSGVNEDGSYQFDGVDDHITIPTLSSGGKQVLMKVNWQKEDTMIYNQNPGEDNFAIYANDYNNNNLVNAYASRNNGSTYIDGILNNNILATQLKDVTHNITITNENVIDNTIIPVIGANAAHNNFYAQMSLYDFMLFDKISTDDKILELNEYVGIEAKIELPPYYWDAYGKTNLDADKATIQQRGVAVGDYDLTNNNFAYDNMSGFGGYTLGKFTNSWSLINNNNSISIVSRNPYDITLKKLGENSDWEFNTTELKIISNPVSVKFKSDKNIRFKCDYHHYIVGGNSEGTPLGITSKDLIANEDTIITISPISQENIDKYNIDINRGYYLIYFQLSLTLAVNEEVTIEMLPLYPNGLVYDGITDYSKNANIPALTDFTVIAKRVWMNKDNPMNECFIHKGVVSTPISESALMLEYEIGNDTYYRSSSYGGYINIERSNRPEIITYQTTESYNGISIIKGSGIDTQGLVVGAVTNNYWKGVFYKLILYPKTIPLLQINFLKNLMERDEIIDLNNKIFIQE